jgi:hypothetical protein
LTGQPKERWIAVDFDGTLAMHHDDWPGGLFIGEPIWPMIEKVKRWLSEGHTVKIFTARVGPQGPYDYGPDEQRAALEEWSERYIGQKLEVTAEKDYRFTEFWDDRAFRIVRNTGKLIDEIAAEAFV